jgi:hypothetical protein
MYRNMEAKFHEFLTPELDRDKLVSASLSDHFSPEVIGPGNFRIANSATIKYLLRIKIQ